MDILDVTGLACPLPILRTKKALKNVAQGGLLKVVATDPGAVRDMDVFCRQTGNELVEWADEGGTYTFVIKRLT
ncbi:sulfurtransferase TusA family protein [Magnetospirillum aberrantis]|uniref:Sulfurtransferase TusA family protein n=1 Tax=Magnetospirillum aberrantis SpK TaxID=908842 RepID=A0A7C9QUY4_9PROT|nr:sulfurtransferase TusA family protein [Magnetospirillum aberrantis]NFV81283.1 sulfurtransferase TusA family protein [Magnetospirillum aberrantis SpK]